MRTVTWLLNSLLQVGLLTLVVLFQPEIRRALEQGVRPISGRPSCVQRKRALQRPQPEGRVARYIIAICDAAERFSETKTGASIAGTPYQPSEIKSETGTPVNSAVNLMRCTIFYEGIAADDGAAIIENGRIKAAGCVLPFPTIWIWARIWAPATAPALALREPGRHCHRGQRGETGIISMAKNGVLIRHFNQSLYPCLIDEMISAESTVEKNTADSWAEQAKKLWTWISQKGEDERHEQPAE